MSLARPQNGNILWFEASAEIPWDGLTSDAIFAIDVVNVGDFNDALPRDFKPATQNNPTSGLPQNVWVGGRARDVWPEILDVRSKVRFLVLEGAPDARELVRALGAWRCPNCGTRGTAPRPKRCPHAAAVCGDVKLAPQIHWVIDRRAPRYNDKTRVQVHTLGARYWPSEFPDV